ncbi:DMT family transporter [Gemmobacter serpentinus]|uniref:DMT family transporter n=1 Tax=Gemmobacter serpentinus TaxID=2652247 RepID=UPI00124C6A61|nr:DMT family transporter [Gemmobacter serpentinus]
MSSDNLRAVMLMNIAMLAFTLNDTSMKLVTETMPLYQAITLRGLLTTLVLLGVALGQGVRIFALGRSDRRVVTLRTLTEVSATVTFLTALTHMPLANLSAILQSVPLAVTLGAALLFGERIGWRRMLAILAGFVGVLLIVKPGTEGFDQWSVLGLLSVVAVVVRDLSTRKLSREVPTVVVAIWAGAAVTLLGLVGMAFTGWQPVTWQEAAIIVAASINLIIGYMTVVMVMRVGDIGLVAPFRYVALLWAIGLGWLIFGTLPDMLTWVGSGIVVLAGIFTLLRERRLRRSAAGPLAATRAAR